MKKYKDSLPREQKKFLKILCCLYENYIENKTPSTDYYFTNPTSDTYNLMLSELESITALINNYIVTNQIFVDSSGNNIAEASIWSSVAQGMIAYNSDSSNNTFTNAVNNLIAVNNVIFNVGSLKTVQKLNTNDCIKKSYQVTPVSVDSTTNVTQASIVARIGCSYVSNIGFIGFAIKVPIDAAPFNNCNIVCCC